MSVFLTNLDDYILPTQACVNPFVLERSEGTSIEEISNKSNNESNNKLKITLETDESYSSFHTNTSGMEHSIKPDLIKVKSSQQSGSIKKVAAVSLNDCLACNGCITSTESVLIEEQSYHKLMDKLKLNDCDIVVGISPQSLASIASFLAISSIDLFFKLSSVLKGLGIKYVIDMTSVGDIVLLEGREEFLFRYKNGFNNEWKSPPSTTSISSTSLHIIEGNANKDLYELNSSNSNIQRLDVGYPKLAQHLPIIVSHCPGWICYAEKSQPQSLQYISTTKSAQQIFGTLVREITSRLEPSHRPLYIVSVQPCFDKKLEASRNDFFHEQNNYREIDLVISTTEIWNLLEDQLALHKSAQSLTGTHIDITMNDFLSKFSSYEESSNTMNIENLFRSCSVDGTNFMSALNENNGSGGYLEYLYRYAMEKLFNISLNNQQLEYKIGRNADIAEVEMTTGADMRTLKFAKAYGFRNIQSIMMKMKRNKCDYDFIEIMACPSGCLNGGGQIRIENTASESSSSMKDRISNLSRVYNENVIVHKPEDSKLAKYIYSPEFLEHPSSSKSIELLHTRYHAVPKLETVAPLATKW